MSLTPSPRQPLAARLLLALLPCGIVIGLAILPLQLIAALGLQLQRQWQEGVVGVFNPMLPLAVSCASLTLIALAWGPLAAGRGGGTEAMECASIKGAAIASASSQRPDRLAWHHSLASLGWRAQLSRALLVAVSHLGGMAVGIESPASSFAASCLLALRRRFKVLHPLPLRLTVALGASAGLAAAFRSPLLGVVHALEESCAAWGLPLVLPTLILAALATLVSSDIGNPVRVAVPPQGDLPPLLLPWALLLTIAAALLGVLFSKLLVVLVPRLQRLLVGRFLPTAVALSLMLGLMAQLSGGLSLNDGASLLGPALAGQATSPRWAVLPRLLSPVLAIASGAPGGLMLDGMSLGAAFSATLVHRLPQDQQAMLVAVGAAATFSATRRTPLVCAVFVSILQGNGRLLPWLLLASGLATAISTACAVPRWCDALLPRQADLPGQLDPAETRGG